VAVPGTTYLDEIVAAHRAAAVASTVRRGAWADRAWEDARRSAPPRPFVEALRAGGERGGRLQVIAEFKRRSPSKGPIAEDADPVATAVRYEAGGAACLSVLTDTAFFGGSPDDLVQARAATGLPVLRKDFTIDELDVVEARCMGADAVLLIAAVLSDAELRACAEAARVLSLAALVEVHDEAELARALDAGATLVGVNQRDLTTFVVDPDRARRVAKAIPGDVVSVAESGIRGSLDARRLADAGYDAVLVGEALMTAADPGAAVAALAGIARV
jgi:indole-3-glycerol phosphate synthase